MARVILQGLVLVVAVATLLDVTAAVEHLVGGTAQKWSFRHVNDSNTLYNDWAANQTFKTGDTLRFEYDNATHSVVQVVEGAYNTCNVTASIDKWMSGNDTVFLSSAGTFYYICGSPLHCAQGMKLAVAATGAPVAAPPPPPPAAIVPSPAVTTMNNSHAAPVHRGVSFSAFAFLVLAAVVFWL